LQDSCEQQQQQQQQAQQQQQQQHPNKLEFYRNQVDPEMGEAKAV
jgi:hypothetical protein